MVLNLSDWSAEHVALYVRLTSQVMLDAIEAEADPEARATLTRALQHAGVLLHRLEAGLGLPEPFPGPHEWGHGLTRGELYGPAEPDLFGAP